MISKSKLALTVLLGTALAMPVVNTIPDAFMSPLIKQTTGSEMTPSAFDNRTIEPVNIYMASGSVEISEGDDVKKLKRGEYVALTHKGNVTELVQVPSEFTGKFAVRISGLYNGEPVKVFAAADEHTEINTSVNRPTYYYTSDFNLYNGHFMKVRDQNNHTLYIDTKQADCTTFTNDSLKVIGTGAETQVVSAEKNLTTDVTARTNLTYDDLLKVTAGTNLEGLENAVIATEEKYGVNSLFILSLAALESGWGTSNLAVNRNNLFGICAYDTNVDAATNFSTKSECIDYFGRLMANEYFVNGRTDLWSINEIYASAPTWASEVNSNMNYMMKLITAK